MNRWTTLFVVFLAFFAHAAEEHGTVFPITDLPQTYTPHENSYSGTPTGGVRFTFVAPADGGYVINYKKDSTESSYFRRYTTSAFSSLFFSRAVTKSSADSILLAAGDSVFYEVQGAYERDSSMSFSISYATVPTLKITVESTSPECSTSVSAQNVLKGTLVLFNATAKEGYRPDGWVLVSGSHRFRDSSAYSIEDTIDADTKIKLICRAARIIDITDKPKTYVGNIDFYDKTPSAGMRFRYEAPTSGIYVLRYQIYGLSGMYRYYGADSSFSSVKQAISNSSGKTTFSVVASAGESYYASVTPTASSYWDDSVSVVALKAGTVKIDGQTKVDTVGFGDSLIVTATLDSGAHFNKWTILSGKGKFVDGSLRSTQFILEESAVIKPDTSRLPLYELTEDFKGYTFANNSTLSRRNSYGIRTYLDPAMDGLYVVQMKTAHASYIYNFTTDSTFYSYSSSNASSGKLRIRVNATAGRKLYFQFIQNTQNLLGDSVWVRALKTVKLRTDTSGLGYAYVGASSYTYDSTYVVGDSVPIRASTSSVNYRFKQWSVSSGTCKILEPNKAYTYIIPDGDCTVKAEFILGTVYDITDVATKYTLIDNYYSIRPSNGVRFSFVAPANGSYTFAFRSIDMPMIIERYTTGQFSSYTTRTTGVTSRFDPLNLSAGDSVFYIVKNYYTADTLKPFWVNYSQSKIGIELIADGNGKVVPDTGYPTAWRGAAYPITASANSGYRFDKWVLESGRGVIDDPNDLKTVAFATESVTIKATFRHGEVYPLTSTEETYNFRSHHYSDSMPGTVRFSWIPSDTNYYLLKLDSAKGQCVVYGTDSLFATEMELYTLNGVTYVPIHGTPGKTYYYSVTDSVKTTSRNKNFTAQIIAPNLLYVESTRGRAIPSGYVYVAPGNDTSLYVLPFGGYVFDSWSKVAGNVTIDNPSNSKVSVKPQSKYCHIVANYVLDSTTVPEVTITNLDLSNHPGICAQVSVVDKNNGKPIVGLDSMDFVLSQDNVALPTQTTTIQSFSGVSVALVVDESGSMKSNGRMDKARDAIRQFINEMGPYDRTAIVGFNGGANAKVHQAMTSNKSLLFKAVEALKDSGNTNINTGAKLGVQQIIGETNPTTVIIFSDGENGSESVTTTQVADLANSLNTSIYSIAVETTGSNTVLKNLANQTGGTYTNAPDASQLSEIYTTIRGSVQSRYVLCYQSPDGIWDGDSHMVEVKTRFMNKDAADTAYWNEDAPPPVVELTPATWDLVGVDQPQNKSLTIDVYVRSKTGITDVRLYMRDVSLSNGSFSSYKMTRKNDTLWQYVVPDSMVRYPGIDFYVVATDSNGLTGKTPTVANPSKEPYTIPVKNDVPIIKMDSLACVDTVGGYGKLRFKITDDDKIDNVTIYYKDSIVVLFDEALMSEVNGYWVASVPSSSFENGIIEFYVRAVDGVGASSRWPRVQNSWIAVCGRKYRAPDVPDTIRVVNADSTQDSITRETSRLKLTLVTEDFSNVTDTVMVNLSCMLSGDEEKVELYEVSPGYYETRNSFPKNERSPKSGDGAISCNGLDILIAEYKDPLYGTFVRDTVNLDDPVEFGYKFLDESGANDLDSVETGESAKFRISLTAFSESIHEIDTLDVLLLTDNGDSLSIKAIETDKYSSIFEYSGAFNFVYDKLDLKSSKLDALFDMQSAHNRVVITAKVNNDNLGDKRDSLVVFSNYIAADVAEIYDGDKDGRADSIRIHFAVPNKEGIEGVDTLYWNKVGGQWRSVAKKEFRVVDGGSWVEAKLKEPFDYGVTFAEGATPPYLKLTKPKGGFSQKVKIQDKIGAVPVKAVKRAGVIGIEEYLDCVNDVPPDTLEITLSEPVQNNGKNDAWKKLFTYSSDCDDSDEHSLKISEWIEKDSTGLVWAFVLGDYSIMTENCIRTNPKSSYIDVQKNAMGRGGIEVEGNNGNQYLYEVVPTPAVSGINSKAKWIAPDEHDWSLVPDTLSVIKVASIMPYTAYVTIIDGYSNVVTSFKREFGDKGEMSEKIRENEGNRAKTGFLDWDNRADGGRKVGTGVYFWRIDFKFKDGHSEYRLVKTGVKRKK